MNNPIYEALNGSAPSPIVNMQNALNQLRSNPVAMLRQAGLNVPDGMNNPQQIIGHLLQSGQINQSKLTQAQQMAAKFRR
jgi:hypothetical protein